MFKSILVMVILAVSLFAEFRLVENGMPLSSISMTTDDSIAVVFQKQVNSTGLIIWENYSTTWTVLTTTWSNITNDYAEPDSSVKVDLNVPVGQASTWTISPTKPYAGFLKISVKNALTYMVLQIPINITMAPPLFTSVVQPKVSGDVSGIRVTTGRSGMILDCLHPFSGRIYSLEGKTVARFTNVTTYKSLPMSKGKYILEASTGMGSNFQRIITLFQ